MRTTKLRGLVAATHTPFHADGSLNLATVEKQAAHLLEHDVDAVFISGTTGEWSSLTLEERRALTERWTEVARGSSLKMLVHVGANCLADSRILARQAQEAGAFAISAVAPSYFTPPDVETLVEFMAELASAAPETPFYYYEIPSLTGLTLSARHFLEEAAERIPNLAGVKFSSTNLMEFQRCLRLREGAFDVPFGCDEMLLAALALGATSAVGSTYNFAAPVYHRLLRAFGAGDFERAREEQFRSVQLVTVLASRGFMGSAKAVMQMLGVDVGPPRLPHAALDKDEPAALRADLERLGFFEWNRSSSRVASRAPGAP